jgi:glycosyltransferase involved in cell wall biosynthesis
VIIPAHNEEPVIGSTIAGVQAQLKEPPLVDLASEVVVVDDGSRDHTAQVAEQYGVIVTRHPTNRGLGAALGTGFQAAQQLQATLVVTFDADGQHNPRDLARVLAPLLSENADLVIGSRLLSSNHIPVIRRCVLWTANLVTWLLFGVWVTDSQSGLRALNRRALEQIEIHTERMEVSSEIVAEAKRLRMRIAEVPIEAIYTEYSRRKGQTVWNSFNVGHKLLLRRMHAPMRAHKTREQSQANEAC